VSAVGENVPPGLALPVRGEPGMAIPGVFALNVATRPAD
jgi:hypothetical protein